ncbi:MAG: HNH endonuclease signature motif containing protein [Clostridia bacterium]|jgi:5-methylcytosine-specific restriction protein A
MLKKYCSTQNCGELIDINKRYCDKHINEYDRRRGSRTERGYDSDWVKLRRRKLMRDPLCEDCLEKGEIEPATEVHHIIKVRDRPDLRLDINNLRSLSKRCHSIRTRLGG